MKHIYSILFVCSFLSVLSGCIEDPDMDTKYQNAKAPEVSVPEVIDKKASVLILKAAIEKENGLPVLECGICWSDSEEGTGLDNLRNNRKVKAEKIENGSFTVPASNLKDETMYWLFSYAINQKDTAFSATAIECSTNRGLGSVKTLSPDSSKIKATSAFLVGKITFRGEGDIQAAGFYLTEKVSKKDSTIYVTEEDINKVDSFSWNVTRLKPETEYYVKAFAKNSFGEFSANVDSFRTTDGKPGVGKISEDGCSYTSANLSALISSIGDSELIAYGFCWSTDADPKIGKTGTDTIQSNDLRDGKFTGIIKNLENAKKYYARAYATNEFGTVYNEGDPISFSTLSKAPNIMTFPIDKELLSKGTAVIGGELQNGGEADAVEWGIYWGSDKKNLQGKIIATDSIFTCTIRGLRGETTYYACAYAKNKNGLIGYGDTISIHTPKIFADKKIYSGARAFSAAFVVDNKAYVVGGDMGNTCTSELLFYIPGQNEWKSMASYKAEYCEMNACVDNNNDVYIIGGTNKQMNVNDFSKYDCFRNSWGELPAIEVGDIPEPRANTITFAYKDSIYAIGGQKLKQGNALSDILIYDKQNGMWKKSSVQFPVSQRNGFAIVVGDVVYAGLGEASGKSLWYATDSLTEWKKIDNVPSNIGVVSSGIYHENRNSIFMIDDNGKIWEYKLEDNEWIARSVFKPSRNYHMFNMDGVIYILGQHVYNTNYFMTYDPDWDN